MRRLILILTTLLLAGSAFAADKLQIMENGKIKLEYLPTTDFSVETDPTNATDGQMWWNETTKQLKVADPLGVYEFNATALVAWDTTPTAFSFTDVTNATTNSTYTSAAITVAGINHPAAISVSGDASAKYSINNATATATNGTVSSGDEVRAVVTSSASAATAVNATVTIGGVSDAFSVTTAGENITYLINEDFEDGLAPDGWSTSNVNYAYTTNPLSGTYSARFGASGGVAYTSPAFSTAHTKTSGHFLFRADSSANTSHLFTLRVGSTSVANIEINGDPLFIVRLIGTATTTQSTAITVGQDYRVWWELETTYNTTQSRFRVWITSPSVTTRPESATLTATRTETVSIPDNVYRTSGATAYFLLDDVRMSEWSITTAE